MRDRADVGGGPVGPEIRQSIGDWGLRIVFILVCRVFRVRNMVNIVIAVVVVAV